MRKMAALALFVTAAVGAASPAFAQAPAQTFRIGDHRWYLLHQGAQPSGDRHMVTFGNVRRLDGQRARAYTLMFSTQLTRVLSVEVEGDCRARTLRMVAGGGVLGDEGALFPENNPPSPVTPGSNNAALLGHICDGDRADEVPDALRAGQAYIAARD